MEGDVPEESVIARSDIRLTLARLKFFEGLNVDIINAIAAELHWLSLPLVVFLLLEGIYMVTLTYYDPLYHTLPQWHKVAGVSLLLLTLLRIVWIITNPAPAVLAQQRWQQLAARLVHRLLYGLLLLLGATGYCFTTAEGHPIEVVAGLKIPALFTLSPASVTLLGELHQWSAYALGGLICLHAGAALQHHFLYRDNTLKRMLKPLP